MTAYTTQYPRTRKARRQPRITRRKTAYTTQYPRTRKARCQPRITRMKGQLQAKTIGTKKPKPIPDDFKFFVYHPTTTPSAADQKPCQTTQSSRKPKSPKLSHINAPSLISKIHASWKLWNKPQNSSTKIVSESYDHPLNVWNLTTRNARYIKNVPPRFSPKM